MHVFELLRALQNALTPALATLPLPRMARSEAVTSTASTPACVYVGGLPPTSPGEFVERVPFVVIQAMSGTEEDGLQRVEVALRVAVRDEDPEAAENHLHNLVSLVRHALMANKSLPLDGRYRLEDSGGKGLCPWTRPDAQEPPYLEAYILTSWTMKGWE